MKSWCDSTCFFVRKFIVGFTPRYLALLGQVAGRVRRMKSEAPRLWQPLKGDVVYLSGYAGEDAQYNGTQGTILNCVDGIYMMSVPGRTEVLEAQAQQLSPDSTSTTVKISTDLQVRLIMRPTR
jgi:hypothetical protein